jgi:hypothetical protein
MTKLVTWRNDVPGVTFNAFVVTHAHETGGLLSRRQTEDVPSGTMLVAIGSRNGLAARARALVARCDELFHRPLALRELERTL